MKEQQWHFTLTCSCPITLPKGPAKCQLHLSSTRQEQRPTENSIRISSTALLLALAAFVCVSVSECLCATCSQ